ncbi:hypothetical protein V6N11_039406 [Hibiscus sabdariffa]|uniref:Protein DETOXIFICATION n=1 Tax=Hibiscus sabdariffa TaxID=183260 RepID=A0ABR2SNI7_9ROSI
MAVGGFLSPWNYMGKLPLFMLFRDSRNVLKNDELGLEIANIGLPATLALIADPVASLIDTAFIGRIGAVELASVGVSIAIFNQVSRITMLPLVSITTSFVAEEEATSISGTEAEEDENSGSNQDVEQEMVPLTGSSDMKITKPKDNRRCVPSASSALVIGCMLGILQTLFLICTAKPILQYMGVKPESPMLKIAEQYLTLRSLGAPAILLSLAAQGVFRGLKDTKTPLYAISKQAFLLINVNFVGNQKQLVEANSDNPLERNSMNGKHLKITISIEFNGFLHIEFVGSIKAIGDSANILLDPIFIFTLRLGVNGAAIAHVVSQYLICLILIWSLVKNVVLLPPSFKELQFGRFLKSENDMEHLQDYDICDVTTSGFHLLVKVISTTSCMTVAASLAARLGPKPMAAFQVCLQIWLATSLLADGLAVAGQAILASAFAKKDYEKTVIAASRVLQIGLVLGLLLSFILAAVSQFASNLFTKDFDVLRLMNISFPFITVTQPINALAFVVDGVNYGASDFAYSAYSMPWLCWNLDCFDHLYVLASVFWSFEDRNWLGPLDLSPELSATEVLIRFPFRPCICPCCKTPAQVPAPAPAPAPTPPGPPDVAKILGKARQYGIFIRLLKSTRVSYRLLGELNNTEDGKTIFAPTDKAFSSLKSGALHSLNDEQRVALVLYHVLPTYVPLSQFLIVSNPMKTEAGDSGDGEFPLNVTTAGKTVTLMTGLTKTNVAGTIYTDGQLAIYRVDQVLQPLQIFGANSPAPAPAPAPGKSLEAAENSEALSIAMHNLGLSAVCVITLALSL